MNSMPSPRPRDGLAACLRLAPYEGLCAEFGEWRIDEYIQAMEKRRAQGRVLAFVRGLKLSAQLIYAIRECVLSGSTVLDADWGHILDEDGLTCSPECDIIIHRGHFARWNGKERPVMDFKFVASDHAVAVISCKSYLRSIDRGYKDYSRKVRSYVQGIWLFAECCHPSAAERLRERAKEAGYSKFWYLYTWDGSERVTNPDAWFDFLDSVEALKNSSS